MNNTLFDALQKCGTGFNYAAEAKRMLDGIIQWDGRALANAENWHLCFLLCNSSNFRVSLLTTERQRQFNEIIEDAKAAHARLTSASLHTEKVTDVVFNNLG